MSLVLKSSDGQGQRWTLSAICFLLLLEYDQIVYQLSNSFTFGEKTQSQLKPFFEKSTLRSDLTERSCERKTILFNEH
jgi:hypothetical protein